MSAKSVGSDDNYRQSLVDVDVNKLLKLKQRLTEEIASESWVIYLTISPSPYYTYGGYVTMALNLPKLLSLGLFKSIVGACLLMWELILNFETQIPRSLYLRGRNIIKSYLNFYAMVSDQIIFEFCLQLQMCNWWTR